MSIAAPIQSHFDGGEISPLCYGRVDSDRYKSSLALCRNWISTLQGALIRRPGTYYINGVKNSANKVRLIPFVYSTTQAYMLEFGPNYIRFYANYGVVLNGGGTPLEVVTAYGAGDLVNLQFIQKADVLYITCNGFVPAMLQRLSSSSFQLVDLDSDVINDGPYLPINSSQITMTPSATTGTSVTVTAGPAQTVTGCVNNGSGLIRVTVTNHGWITGQYVFIEGITGTTESFGDWQIIVVDPNTFDLVGSAFVHTYTGNGGGPNLHPTGPRPFIQYLGSIFTGSILRLENSGVWGWGRVVAGGAYSCTVNVISAFGGTSATKSWTNGLWYGTNQPTTIGFHADRLLFGGTPSDPNRVDGSNVSDYLNFSPTGTDGTVTASNAFSYYLNANDVNATAWLSSDPHGLLVGSVSAEWFLESPVGSSISPVDPPSVTRGTKWGSLAIPAIQIGPATLFVQRGGRKIREMLYYFDINGFRTTDLTELAEHITSNQTTGVSGVSAMVFQSVPYPTVWCLRKDGALLGMTYDREIGQLRTGWHQHILGGQSDAGGTPPIIESIAVIPDPTGVKDDLWMVVNRWINGATVRSIEYLTKVFEDADPQQKAFFLDCGLTLNSPITITGIIPQTVTGHGIQVTATAHGLSNGNIIRIDGVVGFNQTTFNFNFGTLTSSPVPLGQSLVNGIWFQVGNVTTNTFELFTYVSPMGGTSVAYQCVNVVGEEPVYISSGAARLMVQTISGLTYLKGESVYAYADGCLQGPFTVNGSGQITLTERASIVSVGYGYNSDAQLLRPEAGSRNGTAIGKTRRIHRLGIMVHRAQGLQIGQSFTALDPVQFRKQGVDQQSYAAALFSGVETHEAGFDYDMDNMLCLRAGPALPCTILAVAPQLETQDRA